MTPRQALRTGTVAEQMAALRTLRAEHETERMIDRSPGPNREGCGTVTILDADGYARLVDARQTFATGPRPRARPEPFASFVARTAGFSERHVWRLLRIERGCADAVFSTTVTPTLRTAVRLAGIAKERQVKTLKTTQGKFGEMAWMDYLIHRLGSRDDMRVWRQNAGSPELKGGGRIKLMPNGAADIGGVFQNGVLLQIETKMYGVKQNDDQKAWEGMIKRMNAVYIVATYDADLGLEVNGDRVVEELLAAVGAP